MNVVTRGVRNAFRNTIRTFSIVVILGLSIALALAMLLAREAVSDKIQSVKSSIGNTITVSPAGYNPMSETNNSLTTSSLEKVSTLNHVSSVTESLTGRLSTEGATMGSFGFGSQSSDSNATTSLESAIDLDEIRKNAPSGAVGGGAIPSNFSLPVSIVGTTDTTHLDESQVKIKSGKIIDGDQDANAAMVSKAMADKNNLKVGSTFTAYGETLTVDGIFTSGTQTGDGTVLVSLSTLQRLSDQAGTVNKALVSVDSIDNLSSVTDSIKTTLGSAADVQSAQEQTDDTIKPLENIKTVTMYSLVGAVVAGSVIILLTMIMIVRERRREIGVMKAIGASNISIMFQFMVEAVTLTALGAVIGIIGGVIAGNPITDTLVSNSTSSSMESGGPMVFNNVNNSIDNITTSVGWDTILYGLGAAFIIAVIGSSIASFFIAKVRPAEVMRAE